jgi:hypothetical protein
VELAPSDPEARAFLTAAERQTGQAH